MHALQKPETQYDGNKFSAVITVCELLFFAVPQNGIAKTTLRQHEDSVFFLGVPSADRNIQKK